MTNDCPDCYKPLLEIDTGSGKFHCANPICKFQYLDAKTGQEYRKKFQIKRPQEVTYSLDEKPKKILVNLAIEKALLDTGNISLFGNVNEMLFSDYNISISDCIRYPKYLKNTLDKLVDLKTRTQIISSIENILGEFTYYTSVKEFLDMLGS